MWLVVNPSLSDLRAPVPSSSFSVGPSWHFWSRTSLRRAGPPTTVHRGGLPSSAHCHAVGTNNLWDHLQTPRGLPGARLPTCGPLSTRLGTLSPTGRWCLRELELSVQLEPEASKDSPRGNCRKMHSPTFSQLGELRGTGDSQTLLFLSPRWWGVNSPPK